MCIYFTSYLYLSVEDNECFTNITGFGMNKWTNGKSLLQDMTALQNAMGNVDNHPVIITIANVAAKFIKFWNNGSTADTCKNYANVVKA